MTWAEVIIALVKAVAAGAEAYAQHQREVEAARAEVNAQANADLAAVQGPPHG